MALHEDEVQIALQVDCILLSSSLQERHGSQESDVRMRWRGREEWRGRMKCRREEVSHEDEISLQFRLHIMFESACMT